jgi:CarD family transcriptional regulator
LGGLFSWNGLNWYKSKSCTKAGELHPSTAGYLLLIKNTSRSNATLSLKINYRKTTSGNTGLRQGSYSKAMGEQEQAIFNTGDAVVHPNRGVGVVVDIKERKWQGSRSQYYEIELLGREPSVSLMIPVEEADELGIRRAISPSQLDDVWSVLASQPEELPTNHKTRHKFLKDKLHAGDIFQVAEVLRDLTWRRKEEDHLTTRGKRIYKESMMFLAGELAAIQKIDLTEATSQIRAKLKEILSSKS